MEGERRREKEMEGERRREKETYLTVEFIVSVVIS